MNRRTFLASLGALVLAPVAVFQRPKPRPYDFSQPCSGRTIDLMVWDDPPSSVGSWAENGFHGASREKIAEWWTKAIDGRTGPVVELVSGAEFERRMVEGSALR